MTQEDFELDLDAILSEEEEITPTRNVEPSRGIDANTVAEVEIYKQKVAKMEENYNKLQALLESGNKTNFLDAIYNKYSDIDPAIKGMAAEMLQGYNQITQSEMKKMYDIFESLQKDLITTKNSVNNVEQHVAYVQSNYAFDVLIRDTLERGIKEGHIQTRHVNIAKKLHFDRREKDEAYLLKIDNIAHNRNYTPAQKDKMIAQLILENYHAALVKKQKDGKLAKSDPTPKTVIKDKESKELQKEIKKVEDEVEDDSKKEEPKANTQAIINSWNKRLNI